MNDDMKLCQVDLSLFVMGDAKRCRLRSIVRRTGVGWSRRPARDPTKVSLCCPILERRKQKMRRNDDAIKCTSRTNRLAATLSSPSLLCRPREEGWHGAPIGMWVGSVIIDLERCPCHLCQATRGAVRLEGLVKLNPARFL
jgi:hypothetical protein